MINISEKLLTKSSILFIRDHLKGDPNSRRSKCQIVSYCQLQMQVVHKSFILSWVKDGKKMQYKKKSNYSL